MTREERRIEDRRRPEIMGLQDNEDRYILRVLQRVRSNRSAAARLLKIDRRTLQRKLIAYQRRLRREKRLAELRQVQDELQLFDNAGRPRGRGR